MGSLVLTSAELEDVEGWMAGDAVRLNHSGASPVGAGVLNQGEIRTSEGGFAALIGRRVENRGRIVASGGRVELHSVESYYLDFTGDGLLNFEVGTGHSGQVWQSGTGSIEAERVVLQARAASGVLDTVINLEGVVRAVTLGGHGGRITLSGGGNVDTFVSGELDASGEGDAAKGGSVDVFSGRIQLAGGSRVSASGDATAGSVRIGGDFQGGRETMPEGEVNAQVLDVQSGAVIENDRRATDLLDLSLSSGLEARGSVVLWADGGTRFSGSVTTGPQGFVEVSGKRQLIYAPEARVRAPSLLLDPTTIVLTDGSQKGWSLSESQELSANWDFAPRLGAYSQLHVHGTAEGELARPDYAMTLGLPLFESAAASGMQLALRADVISVTGTIRLNEGAPGAIRTLTLSADGSIVFAPGATLMGGRMGLQRLSLQSGADITLGSAALIQSSLADVHSTAPDAVDLRIAAGLIWISAGGRVVLNHATVEAGHVSLAADQVAMAGGALLARGSVGVQGGSTSSVWAAHLWMSARTIGVTGGGASGDATLLGADFNYILGVRGSTDDSLQYRAGSVQLMGAEGIDLRPGAAAGRISLSGGGAVSLSSGRALRAQGLLISAGALDLSAEAALNLEPLGIRTSGSAGLSGGDSVGLTGSAGVTLLAGGTWNIGAAGDVLFSASGSPAGGLSGLTLRAMGGIRITAGGSAHLGVLSAGAADAGAASDRGIRRAFRIQADAIASHEGPLEAMVSVTALQVLELAGLAARSGALLAAATVNLRGGRLSSGGRLIVSAATLHLALDQDGTGIGNATLSGASIVLSASTIHAGGDLSLLGRTLVQISASLSAAGSVRVDSPGAVLMSGRVRAAAVRISASSAAVQRLIATGQDLSLRGATVQAGSGGLSAAGRIDLRADGPLQVSLDEMSAGGGMTLSSGGSVALIGRTAVQISADLSVRAGTDIQRRVPGAAGGNRGRLTVAGSAHFSAGGEVALLRLSVSGKLVVQAARITVQDMAGGGPVTMSAASITLAPGRARALAGGDLSLDFTELVGTVAGTLSSARGAVVLRGRPISFGSSLTIHAATDLTFDARRSNPAHSASALISISGAAHFSAGGRVILDGLSASGDLTVRAGRISIRQVESGASVQLQAGLITLRQVRSDADISLSLSQLVGSAKVILSSTRGSIGFSGGTLSLHPALTARALAGGFSHSGLMRTDDAIELRAGTTIDLGTLSAVKALALLAGTLLRAHEVSGSSVARLEAPAISLNTLRARTNIGLSFSLLRGSGQVTLSAGRHLSIEGSGRISAPAPVHLLAGRHIRISADTLRVNSALTVSTPRDLSAGAISAAGAVRLQGFDIEAARLDAGGAAELSAQSQLYISSSHIRAAGSLSLEAGDFVKVEGSISSGGSLWLSSDQFWLLDAVTASAIILTGNTMKMDGAIGAAGVIRIRAGSTVQAEGSISSGGSLWLSADRFRLLDSVTAAAITLTGNTMQIDGAIDAAGVISIRVRNTVNVGGSISGGGSLWLSSSKFWLSEAVTAAAITLTGNTMQMDRTLAAQIGDFTIHVLKSFGQTGGIFAGRDLSILAEGGLLQDGGMTAGRDIYFRGRGNLGIGGERGLGLFVPGRNVTLHSSEGEIKINDNRDTPLILPGTLRLIAAGAVRTSLDTSETPAPTFSSVTVRIHGPLSINAGTSVEFDTLLVQGEMNIHSDGTVQMGYLSGGASVFVSSGASISAGSLAAAGDVRLSAGSLLALGDTATVHGSAQLWAGQSLQLGGGFSAGAVTATAGARISAAGSISASGQIRMSAPWVQLAGNAAGGSVSFSAASLTVQQVGAAGGDVSLIGRDVLRWLGGVSAHRDIYVFGGGPLNISYAAISAGGSITLSSSGESVALIGAADALLRLGGDLTVHASGHLLRIVRPQTGASDLNTTLSSGASVQIRSGGSVNLGTLRTSDGIEIRASGSVSLREISSGGGVSVSGGTRIGIAGSVSAAGVIHVSAGQVSIGRDALGAAITLSGETLNARLLSAASGDLSLIGRSRFTQAGGLRAHRNIDIRVGSALDISYARISAGGSIFLSAGGGSIAFIGARSDRMTFDGDLTALASGDVLRRISDLNTNPTGADTTLTAHGRVSISAGGDISLGVLQVRGSLHLQALDVIDLKSISAGAPPPTSRPGRASTSPVRPASAGRCASAPRCCGLTPRCSPGR